MENRASKGSDSKVISIQTPFLSIDEASKFLKVAKSTLYGWNHQKRILRFPVRYHGSKPVYLAEELRLWSDLQNETHLKDFKAFVEAALAYREQEELKQGA
jgi:hypothetical protein